MKNLYLSLLFVALFAMSCGNKTKSTEAQEEAQTEVVAPAAEEVTAAPDSTATTEEVAATPDSTATAE